MINLIKTDLKRVFKDKLFLVSCILCVAFAAMTPLLYKLIAVGLEIDDDGVAFLGFSAKGVFAGALAPGNNMGLILPVLVAIILCKDFSHGTVRNKIICGKTRNQIFLSTFITCSIVICSLIIISALISLFLGLALFDYAAPVYNPVTYEYDKVPFNASEFGYLMATIGLALLVYLFISAYVSFLCVSMKNAGLAVVMYVASAFLTTMVGSVCEIASLAEFDNQLLSDAMEFINGINLFYAPLGTGTTYEGDTLAYLLCSGVVFTVGYTLLGMLAFNKKDIK